MFTAIYVHEPSTVVPASVQYCKQIHRPIVRTTAMRSVSANNLRVIRFEDEHTVWGHTVDVICLLCLLLWLTGFRLLTVDYKTSDEKEDENCMLQRIVRRWYSEDGFKL